MAQHHVQVLVSRENFFNNVRYLRGLVAPSKLCVVMKANAYGHGLEALAPVFSCGLVGFHDGRLSAPPGLSNCFFAGLKITA